MKTLLNGEFFPYDPLLFSLNMYMTELSLISAKHSLAKDIKYNETKHKIITRITELGLNDTKYKLDANLLNLICELTEHLLRDQTKDKKINKKELVIDVFNSIFGLTDEDMTTISNSIEFLHSNKLIKKVSYYKLFCSGIYELFLKKR